MIDDNELLKQISCSILRLQMSISHIRLQKLTISIPYAQILNSQLRLVQRLHACRMRRQQYFAGATLTQRLTRIILSYLCAAVHTQLDQIRVNRVYYLCDSQQRKNHILNEARILCHCLQDHATKVTSQSHKLSKELIVTTAVEYFRTRIEEEGRREYVFVDTVCFEDIVTSVFAVEFNQVYLRRAIIERQKLDVFYHYSMRIHKPIELQFAELYVKCKENMQQQSNTQCVLLMNLSKIGYLLAFLQTQEKQDRREYTKRCSQYLTEIQSKVCLSKLGQMREGLSRLLETYPPIVKYSATEHQTLSSVYLMKVCVFFENIVKWQDTLKSALLIMRQRHYEEGYQVRSICFDQKVMLDMLESSCIVQSINTPSDYFEDVYGVKIEKQEMRSDKIDLMESMLPSMKKLYKSYVKYDSPYTVQQSLRLGLKGLIVSTTLSEQDLHLSDLREHSQYSEQIVRAYGVLLHDLCEVTPDGILVYFPSMGAMVRCRREWECKERIYERINALKRIFEESEYEENNNKAVQAYEKYCGASRGGVFLLSMHGGLVDVQLWNYVRCVLFIGMPDKDVTSKLNYLKLSKEHHRYEQGLRTVTKCLNTTMGDGELKVVIFADSQYNKQELQKKWFPFVVEGNLNTLEGVQHSKREFQRNSKYKKIKQQWQNKRK